MVLKKYIDLKQMKVVDIENAPVKKITLNVDINRPCADLLRLFKAQLSNLFDGASEATQYTIDIVPAAQEKCSEEVFNSLVNLVSIAFFDNLVVQPRQGRKRERRLDVPKELYNVHTSASLLKRAINTVTKVDVLNLTISCNSWFYTMTDGE